MPLASPNIVFSFFFLSFFLQAAVFTQSVTTVKWNQDTSLEANLRRRNDDNPRAPRPIKVTFRPSKNRSYQSRFRFEVKEGEGFDLLVSGRGTYQEDTTPNPQPTVGPRMYNGESVSQSVSQSVKRRVHEKVMGGAAAAAPYGASSSLLLR